MTERSEGITKSETFRSSDIILFFASFFSCRLDQFRDATPYACFYLSLSWSQPMVEYINPRQNLLQLEVPNPWFDSHVRRYACEIKQNTQTIVQHSLTTRLASRMKTLYNKNEQLNQALLGPLFGIHYLCLACLKKLRFVPM